MKVNSRLPRLKDGAKRGFDKSVEFTELSEVEEYRKSLGVVSNI